MKLCQTHWEELKQAIRDKGMYHLVAGSSEEIHGKMVKQLEGQLTVPDPLMECNMMIWTRALQQGGLYLMTKPEEGEYYCPLCEVEKHTEPGVATHWIQGCTDAEKKYMEEQGFLSHN